MTESFSKTRLSRARARLRQLLGRTSGEPEEQASGGERVGGVAT